MLLVEYSSNNSGGGWWLTDENWKALEAAGWNVKWKAEEDREGRIFDLDEDGRWLGALATNATKEFASIRECLEEFEAVTGQNVMDEGCNCCGPPHNFSWHPVDNEKDWNYAGGEELGSYLYENAPRSYRDALEDLNS